MVDLGLYFLSMVSVAVVLLGICASVRNSAYASLIREESTGVNLGDKDYEEILQKSGTQAMWAGICFTVMAVFAFVGFALYVFQLITFAEWFGIGTSVAFGVGIFQLARSMLGGYIDWGLPSMRAPQSEDRAKTVEMPDEEVTDITGDEPEVDKAPDRETE